jgi:hypothetical protein
MTFNTEGIGNHLRWQFLFWSDLSNSMTTKTDLVLLQGMHRHHPGVLTMTYIATIGPGIVEKDNYCNKYEYRNTFPQHDL